MIPPLGAVVLAAVLAGGPPSVTDARDYAAEQVGPTQYVCLDQLWQAESGWDPQAGEPWDAYGIPQAHPGTKMADAGEDWLTNPVAQVRWGLDYIEARYGSPCAAWRFWLGRGWY